MTPEASGEGRQEGRPGQSGLRPVGWRDVSERAIKRMPVRMAAPPAMRPREGGSARKRQASNVLTMGSPSTALTTKAAEKVREIGTKEAEREKLVRLAELDKDTGIGKSLANLEQQTAIKDQERRMRVQVAEAEAEAVTGENLARAKSVDAEANLKVRQAEAYQLTETP